MKHSLKIVIYFVGIVLVFIVFVLFSKPKFNEGDCIEPIDHTFIFKISRIEGGKYIIQGFFQKGWGNEVSVEHRVVDRYSNNVPSFHLVPCPQVNPLGTEKLNENRLNQ